MQPPTPPRGAFTLPEFGVLVLILAMLAGVLVPRVSDRLAVSRDTLRISQLRELREAVERFRAEQGRYPRANAPAGGDGYVRSTDGDFLGELVRAGYLQEPARDPLNRGAYYLGYGLFEAGTEGCKGSAPFYVLGVHRFENERFAENHPGYFRCARKDWNADFEHVTGGGASIH
jgi:type II secretory pathway pseudopilin PulG